MNHYNNYDSANHKYKSINKIYGFINLGVILESNFDL